MRLFDWINKTAHSVVGAVENETTTIFHKTGNAVVSAEHTIVDKGKSLETGIVNDTLFVTHKIDDGFNAVEARFKNIENGISNEIKTVGSTIKNDALGIEREFVDIGKGAIHGVENAAIDVEHFGVGVKNFAVKEYNDILKPVLGDIENGLKGVTKAFGFVGNHIEIIMGIGAIYIGASVYDKLKKL
jgi:hypothetical protein